MNATKLRQGQLVAVFLADNVAGATLGYYGTVVSDDAASQHEFPAQPERWRYRVFVPFLNSELRVEAFQLIAFGDTIGAEQPTTPAHQLMFEGSVGEDERLVKGQYRLPGSAIWHSFAFRKEVAARASYSLAMPVRFVPGVPHSLSYTVPESSRLGRQYVLHAMREVFGGPTWQELSD